jgi:hypothetical protein
MGLLFMWRLESSRCFSWSVFRSQINRECCVCSFFENLQFTSCFVQIVRHQRGTYNCLHMDVMGMLLYVSDVSNFVSNHHCKRRQPWMRSFDKSKSRSVPIFVTGTDDVSNLDNITFWSIFMKFMTRIHSDHSGIIVTIGRADLVFCL